MASVANLVWETSTSTGTGNLTVAAFGQRFSDAFGTGVTTDVFPYFIVNRDVPGEWEYGTGHMSDANTLVRDTVIESSNSNAAVSFSAGTKDVANDVPADLSDLLEETTPADTDLFLMQRASDGSYRKVKAENLPGSGGRELLTGPRTYYVRPDGSDTNNGLSDTPGGAFKTIQRAIVAVYGLDLAGNDVLIKVAAGTYTGNISLSVPALGGKLVIEGDTSTPSNVVISHNGYGAFEVSNNASCTVRGFRIINAHAIGQGMLATSGATINFNNIEFAACGRAHLEALSGGLFNVTGNYMISGAAPIHVFCNNGGSFVLSSRTVTITGTPAFSNAFVSATDLSLATVASATFVGSATGRRYSVAFNSVIKTNGGGETYLPGNTAGLASTGGQYA